MKLSLKNALAVLFASGLLVGSAQAGTDTHQFTVTAAVAAQCSINAANIDFGTYDVFALADKTASGSVTVACTKGATVTVDIDDGSNGVRRMTNGTTTLTYDLFSDALLASRWGTGLSGVNPYAPAATAGSTAPVVTTVYANLPQGQTNATPGSYSDTVTATVNF